ncbi:hypothetical protein J6W78_07750 [bacterium]|nr:hypothetical protein [bacterium]
MKKIFAVCAIFTAMFLMISCGEGTTKITGKPDTGDTVTDEDAIDTDSQSDTEPSGDDTEPSDDSDSDDPTDDPTTDPTNPTDPTEQMEEGIYLGIIGFNDDLTISFEDSGQKPIKRLTDANKNEFKNFISSLQQKNYTALYWADYSALEMMESFTISPDLQLKKVALVTFTDGLDNQSLSSDDFNPGPYDSHADYLDAIHSMIMDEDGIHGQPVTAYSIGLKGEDVTDEAKFKNTLEMLATEENGDEKFVFQVTDMSEVGQLFAEIAASLYSVSTTINVGVYIPGGYDPGQVIRYTFDNVTAATSSNLYIEATYKRSGSSRTLENIKYEGFIPGSSTISSSATGPHNELYFQFNDLKYSNGDPVSQSEIISKSRLWKQTSSGAWDGETEMNMAELPPIIDEDKSSALIMLVLDSTTSLGSDFAKMQNEARNFVEILVNGGSGVTESSPCDDNPCAAIANSTHICTVNGSNYVCGCNSGFDWNGSQCVKPATPCNPNPCNNDPNSTGSCTVSGTSYVCGCSGDYNWNGTKCIKPDSAAEECAAVGGNWNSSTGKCTRTQNCSSKPANTVWNTVSSITQTWNGSVWSPSTTSSYSENGSNQYCYYKCASDDYEWNGSACEKPYCSAVFDGEKSKIEVEHNDLLNLGSETWTIEAWIKQGEDDIPTYVIHPIVRKGITSDPAYVLSGYYKQQSGDGYGMTSYVKYSYREWNSTKTDNNRVDQTVTFSDDWTHVAMVKNEETSGAIFEQISYKLLLFVNGTLVGSNEFENTPTVVTNDELLTIGANPVNAERYFKGLIDSIKISNTAKYTADFTPSVLSADDDTIAFWDFSGNADDSSFNGLHGTATNVTYSTDCR